MLKMKNITGGVAALVAINEFSPIDSVTLTARGKKGAGNVGNHFLPARVQQRERSLRESKAPTVFGELVQLGPGSWGYATVPRVSQGQAHRQASSSTPIVSGPPHANHGGKLEHELLRSFTESAQAPAVLIPPPIVIPSYSATSAGAGASASASQSSTPVEHAGELSAADSEVASAPALGSWSATSGSDEKDIRKPGKSPRSIKHHRKFPWHKVEQHFLRLIVAEQIRSNAAAKQEAKVVSWVVVAEELWRRMKANFGVTDADIMVEQYETGTLRYQGSTLKLEQREKLYFEAHGIRYYKRTGKQSRERWTEQETRFTDEVFELEGQRQGETGENYLNIDVDAVTDPVVEAAAAVVGISSGGGASASATEAASRKRKSSASSTANAGYKAGVSRSPIGKGRRRSVREEWKLHPELLLKYYSLVQDALGPVVTDSNSSEDEKPHGKKRTRRQNPSTSVPWTKISKTLHETVLADIKESANPEHPKRWGVNELDAKWLFGANQLKNVWLSFEHREFLDIHQAFAKVCGNETLRRLAAVAGSELQQVKRSEEMGLQEFLSCSLELLKVPVREFEAANTLTLVQSSPRTDAAPVPLPAAAPVAAPVTPTEEEGLDAAASLALFATSTVMSPASVTARGASPSPWQQQPEELMAGLNQAFQISENQNQNQIGSSGELEPKQRSPLGDGYSGVNSRAGSQTGSKHSSPNKSPQSPAARGAKSARASAKPREGGLYFGSNENDEENDVFPSHMPGLLSS